MRNNTHKFSVSWVTIQVASTAVAVFVQGWNAHRVPGRNGGIPNTLAVNTCQINALSSSQVPTIDQAVHIHESSGGQLSRETTFGVDPLAGYSGLQGLHLRDFRALYPSLEDIFSDVLHNHGTMLREAILSFISISLRFAELIV